MVLQSPEHPNQVLEALATLIADQGTERLRVAVAYANPRGVEAFHTLLATAATGIDVEIVVTLDMGITRKAALEMLLDGPAHARVITTLTGSGTFHSKVFVADRDDGSQRAIVGSANLTDAALTRNYEAITAGDLPQADSPSWERWWDELWQAAVELTPQVIDDYTERRPPPGRRERIADEDLATGEDGSVVGPAVPGTTATAAAWLVIDWGGTGEYRVQYEFPRASAAFFGEAVAESRTVTIRHDGVDFTDNQFTFYPDNSMPRINLDPAIPVVADGSIREQASLFTRLGQDHYGLELLDGARRASRLAEAAGRGGIDHTTRRNGTHRMFGWAASSAEARRDP